MKYFKIYLLLSIWFVSFRMYGQLNEFMISVYETKELLDSMSSKMGHNAHFTELKNTYDFNTVLYFMPHVRGNAYNYDLVFKVAHNVGLKGIVGTRNFHSRKSDFTGTEMKADLERYSDSSYGVMGFHIADEPRIVSSTCSHCNVNSYDYIDNISPYTEVIKEHDPTFLRYANLVPNWIFYGENEYREDYIQKYLDITGANLLSFDNYPFYFTPYSYRFFECLYDMGLKSVENSVPFIYVTTTIENSLPYNDPDKNKSYNALPIEKLRYMIYAALSYGAKGIVYYPGFEWIFTNPGTGEYPPRKILTTDNAFGKLGELHAKLQVHSDELLSLNFAAAYHISAKSTIGTSTEQIHDFSLGVDKFLRDYRTVELFSGNIPLYDTSTGQIPTDLMVTYMMNETGQIYFWLFNKNIEDSMNIRLNLASSYFKDILNDRTLYYNSIVTLEPGEAKLFTPANPTSRWEEAFPAFNNIYVYNDGFYPLETFYRLEIGDQFSMLRFEEGAVKTFIAHRIQIKSLSAKEGSLVRFKAYEDSNTKPNRSFFRASERSYQEGSTDWAEELSDNSKVLFYPNPTGGILYLTTSDCIAEIYNLEGRKVGEYRKESEIDISHLLSGVYIMKVYKDDQIKIQKIILNN